MSLPLSALTEYLLNEWRFYHLYPFLEKKLITVLKSLGKEFLTVNEYP